MYIKNYEIEVFEKAETFILNLPEKEKAVVFANIAMMKTSFSGVNTRLLGRPIKELKIKNVRILFFIDKNKIYLVSGFYKKSQKTPKSEIDYALGVYKEFKK